MDLHAYHRALNLGFSESEASRIGDDAWENNRQQPTCDPEPEPDYYDVLVAENTQLRAELAKADGQINRCVEQNKYLESTISRLRSALTSIYLYQQDIGHPPLHSVAEGMRKMAHDALRAAMAGGEK